METTHGPNYQLNSLQQFIQIISAPRVPSYYKTLLGYIAWTIWNARNASIFNGISLHSGGLYSSSLWFVRNHIQATSMQSMTDNPQSWRTDGSMSPSLPFDRLVSWVPPPCDQVKINFDASWTTDRIGLGYIIRDHYGVVLFVEAIHCLKI